MEELIKQKWVEALRSGKYKQSIGALRKDNKYCCLGVLCDLYRKEKGEGRWKIWKEDGLMAEFHDAVGKTDFMGLTPHVAEWAGLPLSPYIPKNRKLVFVSKKSTPYLSEINDSGATFSEIADLIDKNL